MVELPAWSWREDAVEFCEARRRYRYIGLCHGPPGVGKTLSAREYARWDLLEPLLSRFVLGDEPPVGVDDCNTVLYTPEVANTPRVSPARRQIAWQKRRQIPGKVTVWVAVPPGAPRVREHEVVACCHVARTRHPRPLCRSRAGAWRPPAQPLMLR